MKKRVVVGMILALSLTTIGGCSKKEADVVTKETVVETTGVSSEAKKEDVTEATLANGAFEASDLTFEYKGVPLTPNQLFEETSISEEYEYYETQSCGFVGLDKIYTYANVEVYTYPNEDKDYILEVDLLSGAKTSKGIEIGSTYEAVIAAYGAPTEDNGSMVEYVMEDKSLSFTMSSDKKVEEVRYIYNY